MTQPSKPLKPTQKITLDALKIAIQRVNIEQLPEDFREKINSIETESSEYNYQVIDEIIASIENISHFNAAYQKARDELTKDYNSKEKTKIASSYPSNHSPSRAKTEQEINPKALFILQELENYPLTLEDLKYRLNLKSEEVHQIVKQLWNERKVNKVSGSIWYSLFPITKPRRFDITEDDSHTSFTLTTLGEIELRRFSNYR